MNAYASGAADASAANEHTVAENPVITVKQGDTIWAIAKRYAADGTDIRKIVWQIKRVNHLETGIIHAGDRLLIPGSVVEQ
ncbi:MAG TPA: LysM peptidoglycan-binding domain-containing protein [Bacilli bacterium]